MMKKLRWAMDGEFWEVDLSTAVTLDGVARAGGDGVPLPLGLSRGARLSRPKQIDFLQRFMAVPLVPTFCEEVGLSLQRLISLPLPGGDAWFATLLGQLNVQRLVSSSLRRRRSGVAQEDSFLQSFPNHNLTLEASSPSLFVDNLGNYWDVPFTLAMDLASAAPSSTGGASCHFCVNHNAGSPQQHQQGKGHAVPPPPISMLPGLSAKCAVSLNKNFYIWRSEAPKARMVQPYDILLSNPHVSASAILGALVTASLPLADKDKHDSITTREEDRNRNMISLCTKGALVSADLFASASLSAQLGNFQKPFFDLTRFHARLDIPSGSKFLNGASEVALALYNSQPPTVEALQAITPSATLSFQQQIAGPFSFRMDAGVSLDLKKDRDGGPYLNVNDPVFAVEYALQVLASAKAVAWYSPKQREFMIELRFFET
ncbi:hypothetical protein C2S53_008288 [Perilla frutescens var. hirtella]|uniref:Uncharacterized protein n=1 Tax=Perilla frutescens var. hirtella TaxID=608512 RepID=A0AAD4JES3_PERFH|nr:hypothetical protein C2S53_008288 [Perilla frutescens var. hirtella]